MIQNIKKELLNNPEKIIQVLEYYDYYLPRIHNNEIRCGFSDGCNHNAIRIKLQHNENLFVIDYVRQINYDILVYIIKTRHVEYKDVMNVIKNILGIDDFTSHYQSHEIFGGFYNKIKSRESKLCIKTYSDNILDEYKNVYCERFANDNISYETQNRFEIRYDTVSQRIVIPIYNPIGELIGVKGRANWDITDDDLKYYYLIPCAMSSTLFGLCQNYEYLSEGTIYVFEAEKSVMQCHSYGIYNAVSLGSNSLSSTQCKLLMQFFPQRIVFMLDRDLPYENTLANVKKLQPYLRMKDTKLYWWDWHNSELPEKSSPSDYGKKQLMDIIDNELIEIEESD